MVPRCENTTKVPVPFVVFLGDDGGDGADAGVGCREGGAIVADDKDDFALDAKVADLAKEHVRLLGRVLDRDGDGHAPKGHQMHERVLGDVGVGDDDGLPAGIFDGRMAPGDILDHARHAADLDIVAGFDNAHKRHLHTADEV